MNKNNIVATICEIAPLVANILGMSPEVSGFVNTTAAVSTLAQHIKQHLTEERLEVLIKNIQRRMGSVESKLECFNSNELEMFKHDVIPVVFHFTTEEIEQEKIYLISNGMEYCIDNKLLQQDEVIELYDTLHALRIKDIKIFMKIKDGDFNDDEKVDRYRVDKLVTQGIISVVNTYGSLDGHSPYLFKQLKISDYGSTFFNFIKTQN